MTIVEGERILPMDRPAVGKFTDTMRHVASCLLHISWYLLVFVFLQIHLFLRRHSVFPNRVHPYSAYFGFLSRSMRQNIRPQNMFESVLSITQIPDTVAIFDENVPLASILICLELGMESQFRYFTPSSDFVPTQIKFLIISNMSPRSTQIVYQKASHYHCSESYIDRKRIDLHPIKILNALSFNLCNFYCFHPVLKKKSKIGVNWKVFVYSGS